MNFHCLLALLSFGGSQEPALVKLTGTTVEDSVKFGLIGAHLGRQACILFSSLLVGSRHDLFPSSTFFLYVVLCGSRRHMFFAALLLMSRFETVTVPCVLYCTPVQVITNYNSDGMCVINDLGQCTRSQLLVPLQRMSTNAACSTKRFTLSICFSSQIAFYRLLPFLGT